MLRAMIHQPLIPPVNVDSPAHPGNRNIKQRIMLDVMIHQPWLPSIMVDQPAHSGHRRIREGIMLRAMIHQTWLATVTVDSPAQNMDFKAFLEVNCLLNKAEGVEGVKRKMHHHIHENGLKRVRLNAS